MDDVREQLQAAVKTAFNEDITIELTRPEEQFGDYASNVALQLSKKVGQNPREVAETIAKELSASKKFAKVEVAGPGFINLTLNDDSLLDVINTVLLVETIKGLGQFV